MKTFLKVAGVVLGVTAVTFIVYLLSPNSIKLMNTYNGIFPKCR